MAAPLVHGPYAVGGWPVSNGGIMPLSSCKEAKAAGEKYYFTGKPCKNGHICLRDIHKACVECRKARNRVRYRKNYIKKIRKPRGQYYLRLLRSARMRAKHKNVLYDLTTEWAQKKWTGICELSGITFLLPHSHKTGQAVPFSPTIDRINPLNGYTKDNCRFILYAINTFKSRMSDKEMFEIIKELIINQNRGSAHQ